MDKLEHDTFVVLDVPPPQAEGVNRVRAGNAYPMTEPVTISVAGSSGVGVFSDDQRPSEAFGILDALALRTAPIAAEFSSVHRWPGTEIFVFTLTDEEPFRALHEVLAASRLKFRESPFPYRPHCTFRITAPRDEPHAQELSRLTLPGRFLLDQMSVYGWRKLPSGEVDCPHYHRVTLSGCDDA